jgi:hypothetical protein
LNLLVVCGVEQQEEHMQATSRTLALAVMLMAAVAVPAAAQQPIVSVDGDDITITGCLARASARPSYAPTVLVWTRGDIMLAAPASGVPPAVGTTSGTQRVFYWIDQADELIGHLGQRVEIKGEFEDFEEGQIEVDRDDDYVEMELDLGGREEKVRMPASWFDNPVPDDLEINFIARKVDVEDVRVLGACY